MQFDDRVMQAIDAHRTAWANAVGKGLMNLGTTPAGEIVLVAAVVVAVIRWRAYRPALVALLALLVAGAAADVLKHVFDRPRPPIRWALVPVAGPSFPSTHAAATAAVAAAFVVAYPWATAAAERVAAIVSGAVVVVIGVSMVYLGSHWLTDVLAGWLLGLVVGYILGRALRRRPLPALRTG